MASVLFRREILNASVFCELNKVYEGGFCFFITATIMGRVLGISKCLSVYRINDGGVSNNMHVWDIIDRRYRYAKVTKDKTVIKYVDGVALRRLIEVMPHYLIGNSDARKYVSVIKNHSKVSYYKSIIMFPFYLPMLMLRKLKKNDEQ